MELKALRDELIIEKVFEEKKGLIFIPDNQGGKKYHGSYHGIVHAIGPEYPYKDDVKIGSKVFFRRHEGKKIKIDNKEYYTIKEKFIEGVFN